MADYPTTIMLAWIPRLDPFLVIPEVQVRSGGNMFPSAGWHRPLFRSKSYGLPNADSKADFALLTSAMHMAWMRAISGRMKSDYMYSVGVVYNTFPTPPGDADLSKLEPLAQAVLDARAAHPEATLADLYDPDLMPPDLRRAHQALDRAVDRLYRRTGFASERERVEHLFALYEKMRAPLEARVMRKPQSNTHRKGK